MWYKGNNSYDLDFLNKFFTSEALCAADNIQYFLIYYMLEINIPYYDPPTIQMHERYFITYKKLVKTYGRTI